MLARAMSRTISIIGAGRVGASLARLLRRRAWRIGAVVTRSAASARAAVRTIGAGTPFAHPTLEVLDARLVLIAVPDSAIAQAAASLAEIAGRECKGKIVLHTSGALSASVLAPLARRGVFIGSLHPMQTFTGRNTPNLKGVVFAVEGHPRARRAAAQIARQLGGLPVTIEGSGKPAYHAAGALAAGHALALVEAATCILVAQGFSGAAPLRLCFRSRARCS